MKGTMSPACLSPLWHPWHPLWWMVLASKLLGIIFNIIIFIIRIFEYLLLNNITYWGLSLRLFYLGFDLCSPGQVFKKPLLWCRQVSQVVAASLQVEGITIKHYWQYLFGLWLDKTQFDISPGMAGLCLTLTSGKYYKWLVEILFVNLLQRSRDSSVGEHHCLWPLSSTLATVSDYKRLNKSGCHTKYSIRQIESNIYYQTLSNIYDSKVCIKQNRPGVEAAPVRSAQDEWIHLDPSLPSFKMPYVCLI